MVLGGNPNSTTAAPASITAAFPGALDEVRLYHRALSDAEITALFTTP